MIIISGGLIYYQILYLNYLLRNSRTEQKNSMKKVRKTVQEQGMSCFGIVKKTGPFFWDVENGHQKRTSKKSRKQPKNATVKRPIVHGRLWGENADKGKTLISSIFKTNTESKDTQPLLLRYQISQLLHYICCPKVVTCTQPQHC